MKLLRRLLYSLVFLLVLSVTSLFVFSGRLLENYTRSMIPLMMSHVQMIGLENPKVWFEKAEVSLGGTLIWHGVGARFELDSGQKRVRFLGNIKKLEVAFPNFGSERIQIAAHDFNVRPLGFSSGGLEEGGVKALSDVYVQGSRFFVEHPFGWKNANYHVKEVFRIVGALVQGERVAYPMELEAVVFFRLDGKKVSAGTYLKEEAGSYALAMRVSDLRRIVSAKEVSYTDAELELMSEYPTRVPNLLSIKNRAAATARTAAAEDDSVPEDAYRHILWSYYMSREYGTDFAKLVTDAHEAQTIETHPLDSEMDLINNQIGRRYAREGLAEQRILAEIRTDMRVVRR